MLQKYHIADLQCIHSYAHNTPIGVGVFIRSVDLNISLLLSSGCMLLADCSLKALADKVASKWQNYLQFKAEIYLAYVGVFARFLTSLICLMH